MGFEGGHAKKYGFRRGGVGKTILGVKGGHRQKFFQVLQLQRYL